MGRRLGELGEAGLTKLNNFQGRLVEKLDLKTVAQSLSKIDVDKVGVRATLVRIKALQEDPEAIIKLAKKHEVFPAWNASMSEAKIRSFVNMSASHPEELLTVKQLKEIDSILDEMAKNNKALGW